MLLTKLSIYICLTVLSEPSMQDSDFLDIHLHLDELKSEAGQEVGADYSDAANAMNAEASIKEGTKDGKITKDLISGFDAKKIRRTAIRKTANVKMKGTDYNNIDIADVCKNVKCRNSSSRRRRHKRNTEGDKINIACCRELGGGGNSGSSSSSSSSGSGGSSIKSSGSSEGPPSESYENHSVGQWVLRS